MNSVTTGSLLALSVLVTIFSCTADAQMAADSAGIIIVPSATSKEIGPDWRKVRGIWREIYATPPELTLISHSPQAHPGKIWLRSTDDGLHIWGEVQADEKNFRWPREKSEMLSSDHIDVWLGTSLNVDMPEIGWGNQFGKNKLNSLKDCAGQEDNKGDQVAGSEECERWYNKQMLYRRYLPRLFRRQWLIAGNDSGVGYGHAFEGFASTAWAALNANFFAEDLPTQLQPDPDDNLFFDVDEESRPEIKNDASGHPQNYQHQTGYTFHIFIPYSAFPPAQQQKLTDLYLVVDVFSAAREGQKVGDFSSTAPTPQWGNPTSFNHLRLVAPRTFSVSPCDYDLQQDDLYGEGHSAWFFPTLPGKGADLQSTFALINPAGGYLYEPARMSPAVETARYFWKKLANGAAVCGPHLAWRDGATIKRTEYTIDEKYLAVKALPDQWSFLRSGPFATTWSPFGSGECGGCEVLNFDLFAVSPLGEIASALHIEQDLSGDNDGPTTANVTMTSDWTRVTLYLSANDNGQTNPPPAWTSVTYCLAGHSYKQCSESQHAQPPNPIRVLPVDDPNGN